MARPRIFLNGLIVLAGLFLFTLAGGAQQAPMAGLNVNMVSGTTSFKDGDPFLQRQNEVSIAVSTRNEQHLFAGANDYRTVDLPAAFTGDDPDFTVQGDAWLGAFKSFDGGSSWKSGLVPGYPQDTSAAGLASPLKGFTTASDPIVRAGTNGLFYYSGIAFNRDAKEKGVFFVARYIDNNNKETGDSIQYLNSVIVDRGSTGRFIDKPALAVDVPRAGAGKCSILSSQDNKVIAQSVPAGNVYVAYTEFVGKGNNINSRILFARSPNCGESWNTAVRVTEGSPKLQGAAIAIDPNTGYIYVAWRQFRTYKTDGSVDVADAIWVAKSVNQGASFTRPINIAQIRPFDQTTNLPGESFRQFRTTAYPTITVDDSGRVYVAWSQVGTGADGGARILVKTSMDGQNWSGTPTVVTDSPPSPRGQQIMPQLTFAAGKLMLTYFDFRDDLALAPPPLGPPTALPGSGIIADPVIRSGRPYLHTIDGRAAQASPADAPLFVSTRISKYLFDLVPTAGQPPQLRQLQYNPPNLPLFNQGSQPFIGDYIDIAPPPFVFLNGRWQWNLASGDSEVFHAAWTDNRDVRAPPDYDWTRYTPPGAVAGARSTFDPSRTLDQCVPSRAGMRDQNVYTSRITQGLLVTVPGNSKPLGRLQRAYVVFVQNTNPPNIKNPLSSVKYFRLTIQTPLPAGTIASFLQFQPQNSIEVAIPARSSIARSVFVTSSDPDASVTVHVQQIDRIGAPAPTPGGLSSSVVINPDVLNPDVLNPDVLNPDVLNPDVLNAEVYNPDISNTVQIVSISNPDVLNPDVLNPDVLNPDVLNPDVLNPDVLNPDVLNPDVLNPDVLNPNIFNPDVLNPDVLNPSIADVKDIIWTVSNKGNTTSSFTFKNFVNRNPAAFAFQLLVYKVYTTPASDNCIVKPSMHQELVVNILNPDVLNPDVLNPDVLNPDILNATFYLAPFESAKVALRVIDRDKNDDAQITINGAPVPPPTPGVAQVFPIESVQIAAADVNAVIVAQEVNTPDAVQGITTPPAATARLTIVTQELPSGRVGQAYTARLQADGGTTPYTWSILAGQGATPNSIGASGLTLNAATGDISGTPVAAGTFSFSVSVTDNAAHVDHRDLAIAVSPALGTATLAVVSQPNPCFDTANLQPTCVLVHDVIVPAVSAKAINSSGIAVPNVQVTLSIGSGPAGAVLSGTLVRTTNADGVAVFNDLSLNLTGTYKLSAAAPGFTVAATGNFNVAQRTLVVVNTNDSGPGSLRQAIFDANATTSEQVPQIVFNIPGPGPFFDIKPSSALPNMMRPVSIDATTQPGYAGHPIVQIDGSLAPAGTDGLTLKGGNSLVRGLAIGGFTRNGILLDTGGGNRIIGNYIGTNLAGTASSGHQTAILITNSPGNFIGGTAGTTPGGPCTGECNVLVATNVVNPATYHSAVDIEGALSAGNQVLANFINTNAAGTEGINGTTTLGVFTNAPGTMIGDGTPGGRNVISGGDIDIWSRGSNTSIKGNFVGTNAAGTAALLNSTSGANNSLNGIQLELDHGLIENNVISGINGVAVKLAHATSAHNTTRGNIIGLNAAGNAVIGNYYGVLVYNAANQNTIGPGNVVSGTFAGNTFGAVTVGSDGTEPGPTGNRIIGNYIGTTAGGVAIGNAFWGVIIDSSAGNSVGGTAAGEGNVIAFNDGGGVAVAESITGRSSTRNPILGNSIFANGGLGIDLFTGPAGTPGVTPDDPLDADIGPNNVQNFPVITSATTTTLTGMLNSTPATTFTIQLFQNNVCHASNYGEGQTLIATFSVTTDASGNAAFPTLGPFSLLNGQFVTSTATDPNGNTSEFSLCVPVAYHVVSNVNDNGPGSLRQAMLDANASSGPARIVFNIVPAAASYTISPLTPLPAMTRPVSIDGTTQPGYTGHPVVLIDGRSAGAGASGFVLRGGSSLVRGLALGGFAGNGIVLQTGGNNRIAGNYLGTNLAGSELLGITGFTIYVQDSANNTIGGTGGTTPGGPCTGDCNVIVGRGDAIGGVQIQGASAGNRILGNFVGTDATGNIGMNGPNTYGIVAAYPVPNTSIGDGTPAGRNVIAGTNIGVVSSGLNVSIDGNYFGLNAAGTIYVTNLFGGANANGTGIEVLNGDHQVIQNNVFSSNGNAVVAVGSAFTTIRANLIGFDASGTTALGNSAGIIIETGSHDSLIGGTTPADRNIISNNTLYGVFVGSDPAVTGNRIIGNYIGTNPSGTAAAANGGPGVIIDSVKGNFVGGANAGEGNLIAFNGGPGVSVTGVGATGNPILGNSIFGNGGIGIDLGADGVTPNDGAPDADNGPNGLQNFPIITGATTTSITGEIFTAPNLDFTVQLFSSDTANHEGKTLVATTVVHTDGAGHASIGPVAVALVTGKWISATATDPNGNTSEFSNAVKVP